MRIFVKLFLIFVLVYTGVTIWYGRLEDKLQLKPVAVPKAVAPEPEEKMEIIRKPNDYTMIVRRNIFQAVVEKKEEVEVKEEPPKVLEPTKLKLSLMGTVFGREKDARAIISDDIKRSQDIYQVGDSIQGAIIKEVTRGKVVLEVNGRDEVLTLKDREGGGPAYQPSPSDYYKDSSHPQAAQAPATATRSTPRTVRPRPVRRPPAPRSTGNATER